MAGMRTLLAAFVLLAPALAGPVYQKPPKEVLDVLNAPVSPDVSVSPARTHLLLLESVRYPPIAELAQPMLRLAGRRINPATNGEHNPKQYNGLTLKKLDGGADVRLSLPPSPRLAAPRWSADGQRFAFTNTRAGGIDLWVAETAAGSTKKLAGVAVNAAHGEPFEWLSGGRRLLVQLVPSGRGKPPAASLVPTGPNVQESSGKAGPVRTYQDLLQNAHDEDLFDYYATAQLAVVDVVTGKVTPVGKPAIFQTVDASPDGRYILVERLHRPYSYLHTSSAFPKDIEVWDMGGKLVRKIASLPLQERVPIEGVSTGPRYMQWRPTEPATLVWVEALDGGDPGRKVAHRDRIVMLKAPFEGEPAEVFRAEHRLSGYGRSEGGSSVIGWTEKGDLALVREYDRNRHWSRTFAINPDLPAQTPRLVWSRSSQDRYKDPGRPIERTLAGGRRAILQDGDNIFLHGDGATPQGDRPFLDRFNLTTLKTQRLFVCDEKSYETVVALLDGRILTARETPTEPRNYFLRALGSGAPPRALTAFQDPTPQVRGIRKRLITYQRPDGVPLSFTLYLPPGYKEGTPLPTVMWAYPREYTDPEVAGQVSGSPYRFTTITGTSHLFFLLAGYAVLDNAAMPVVGDPRTVNDTYLEQIVMSAKAAIDKAAAMGVADPKRVGVGGHSYGSFMTANLLAHCDLFRAGIARSGAHNRTLTPFGFQSERRTLWEAPEIYLKMSPFMYAHRIKAPLLLIHGEADNNDGTFPIQSERMYQAVRGNGGTVRLVLLPLESHGYSARESIEHTLYEMISWFEKYVKN